MMGSRPKHEFCYIPSIHTCLYLLASELISGYLHMWAARNFIEWSLAAELRISHLPLVMPITVSAVDGSALATGLQWFHTTCITMHVRVLHYEEISFLILP